MSIYTNTTKFALGSNKKIPALLWARLFANLAFFCVTNLVYKAFFREAPEIKETNDGLVITARLSYKSLLSGRHGI